MDNNPCLPDLPFLLVSSKNSNYSLRIKTNAHIKSIDAEYIVVCFDNSETGYHYSHGNVFEIKTRERSLNPNEIKVILQSNKSTVAGISQINSLNGSLGKVWEVVYKSGSIRYYRFDELDITKRITSTNPYLYLRRMAEEIERGDTSGAGRNYLTRQFQKMRKEDETALRPFLNIKPISSSYSINSSSEQDSLPIIFPFGCNLSQIQATKNALKHQISVIEGPPGTGKTQTILTIIANLIIRNKTILIASPNNSATKKCKRKII